MNVFDFFVIYSFCILLYDLWYIWYCSKQSKKCNYDCSKCKIWDCPNHECLKHRK